MTFPQVIGELPLLALLMWAVVEDFRSRRIPNALTLGLALSGLAMSLTAWGRVSPAQSLLGLMVGFALPFVFFALRAMGGGDVKLCAALGAWMGPGAVLWMLAVAALAGAVLILFQSLWQRRLAALFRSTWMVTVNLLSLGRLGVRQVLETGPALSSSRASVPYALPIAIAAVLTLWTPGLLFLTWRQL